MAPNDLTIVWSPIYQPAWDADPAAYVEAGSVGWGKSRRLARAEDGTRRFKAYLGVHHSDPARWGSADMPHASFFLSLFRDGRTLSLHTYPTMAICLAALRAAYATLRLTEPSGA